MKRPIFLLSLMLTLSTENYGFPDVQENSVVFDDEVEEALETWFGKITKGSPQFSKTLTPKIFLVAHHTVNAGAGAGGKFVVFSGLFKQCETIEEFLGVVAHEMAHVKGHHMIKMHQAEEKNMLIAALSFALGGVAALAAGDMAPLIAGLAGGQGMFVSGVLKHTRDLEIQADADAVELLHRAGIPATGLLSFLQKLEKLYRSPDVNPYHQTHPLTSDRIVALRHRIQQSPQKIWTERGKWQEVYAHVRTKILAFTLRPKEVLNLYSGSSPDDAFARAIAYGRMHQGRKALEELEKAMAARPKDAFLLEVKAQLLLDQKDVRGAIALLEKGVSLQPKAMYLKISLAHLLIEQHQDTDKALSILKEITQRGDHGEFAWYLLGKGYAQKNLPGHALWANAEYDLRMGDAKAAEVKLKRAKNYISTEPALTLKIGDSHVDLREEKEKQEKG